MDCNEEIKLSSVHFIVVGLSGLDHFFSVFCPVSFNNFDISNSDRGQFIGFKVVMKSIQKCFADLLQLVYMFPKWIFVQYRDDFVIRLAAVDHLHTPDNTSAQNDLSAIDWTFADDADIKWITIPFF